VPDYCRPTKEDDGWEYSDATARLIAAYAQQAPWLVRALGEEARAQAVRYLEHCCSLGVSAAGVHNLLLSLHAEGAQASEAPLLCGDAADLHENLEHDIAPGLCWEEREDLALASIRKLKALALESGAQLWPNHDLAFWAGTMAARDWH
jgi:hypothetical protein